VYPYNFIPARKSINQQEIFIAMPFEAGFDDIFHQLIEPATATASDSLGFKGEAEKLHAYRSKDDIRTVAGWINVLEHLLTAKIVLGVLESNNPNVIYELGIAHFALPIDRQILIAQYGYEPLFDLKDLIFEIYHRPLVPNDVIKLATKIEGAIRLQRLEHDRRLSRLRMRINPMGFSVIMTYRSVQNFPFRLAKWFKEEYTKVHGEDSFEHHLNGIANLCDAGVLGLNTRAIKEQSAVTADTQEFSYWWTGIGNEMLRQMELISENELQSRLKVMPAHFR